MCPRPRRSASARAVSNHSGSIARHDVTLGARRPGSLARQLPSWADSPGSSPPSGRPVPPRARSTRSSPRAPTSSASTSRTARTRSTARSSPASARPRPASGRHVAILQDLSGPKIRTGKLVDRKAIDLVPGATLEIATGDFVGGPGRVSTTFAGLAKSVRPRRSAAARRRPHRAARRVVGRHDGEDHRRRRRLARRAQGHQPAGRRAAGLGADAQGHRRPALRALARRRHRRAQLRPDGRGPAHGAGHRRRIGRRTDAAHRQDRAARRGRQPRRHPRRRRRGDGRARRSRARDAVRARPGGPEGDHAAGAPPRPAGDRRDAGVRLDAHRARGRPAPR